MTLEAAVDNFLSAFACALSRQADDDDSPLAAFNLDKMFTEIEASSDRWQRVRAAFKTMREMRGMDKFADGQSIKNALCDKLAQADQAGTQVTRIEIGMAEVAMEMMDYPFPAAHADRSLLTCPLFGHQVVSERNPNTELFEPMLRLADGTLL